MSIDPEDLTELRRTLREAGTIELADLLERHGDELDVASARQALRNPFVTSEGIQRLLECRGLRESPEMRRDFALHPRTPLTQALRLIPSLRWRDLAQVGAESRVHPQMRRAADLNLAQRLPGLTLGERIALARIAGHGVIQRLRTESSPRVIAALLENPRITEGALAPVLASENTPPEILRLIADHPRWGIRHPVRFALCRNPRTPVPTALSLVPLLRAADLRQLVRLGRLSPAVRSAAERILGRQGGGRASRAGGPSGRWR